MVSETGKKTVVFILPTLTAGGAERVLITLMNNISREKFSPHFIALDERGPLKPWIDPTLPFHTLGHRRVKDSYIPLLRMLKGLNPHIVVTTMAHVNFLALLLKPFFPGVRFIVREANVPRSMFEGCGSLKKFLIRWGYKNLYPHADLIISPAQRIVDDFEVSLHMDTENHAVLHNPVDTKKIYAKIGEEPFEKRSGSVQFICAGRIHYQKGFDRLVEHLGDLKMSHDWHLTIMGTGDEEGLRALVRKQGLEDKITLAGLVKNPWVHMAQADCFLLPSRWEGLPNVVLESLACGTKVIATEEAGGIEEIALKARPGDVRVTTTMEEFIAAMRDVEPDPVETMRESLLPVEFDLDTVIRKFESLLI